ncbi:hypothetical protein H4219_003157 [Mycoemilia scoparia]|uniref:Uncharacterized protein n=1 Tax=Mycoemilia scoparia TaxID=417184 RepID=A0A9W8A1D0_9FUNG|nr:hypothetical protein H4219_003157 [Mycoemilia scoparia]
MCRYRLLSSVLDYEGWIQTLSTHPIFRAESSSRSSHYLSDKRNSRVPHRQLVVRETDLIVAVGSEIRAISLKLCKDVCIKANISRHSIKKGGSMQYTLECMRKAVQSVPFAILGSSGVDFHIKQLSLSPNGDMLAISGESRLAIMSLPRPATIRVIRSDSTLRSLHLPSLTESSVEVQNVVEVPVLDCRVLYVSEGHDKNGKTETSEVDRGSHSTPYGSWTSGKGNMKISKTLWHPCSSRGSHLLVLYQAGYVKMFDVSQSVDVPEQVFDMTTSMQADAPYRSVELASFCFGNQKSNDWGRITLYIATNWGDIYTLSPVVPESWIADKSWLEDLLVQSQTQIRERQGEEYTLNKQRILSPELAKAISQEQWITAALSSAKALGNNSLCQIVAKGIKLRTTLLQSPAPQGPYLLQPEPPIASDDESSDSSSNDDSDATDSSDGQSSEDFSTSSGPKFNEDSVCDIACLETSPVGIICLGYNNGHIDTFAILDPVSGQWPFQKNVKVDKTDSLPTLVTLESIVLHGVKPASTVGQILKPLGRNGRIPGHFVTDPNYPYTLFYAHERGVHFINLKAWDSYFKDALLRETTVSFGSTEKAPVQLPEGSDIRCLVNTHPVNTK